MRRTPAALLSLASSLLLAPAFPGASDAATAAGMAGATRVPASARLNALAERYYDELLALTPTLATKTGEHRYDDRLEDSATPDYQKAQLALAHRYREALSRIDPQSLDGSALVTRDVMADKLDTTLAGAPYPDYLFSFDQIQGVPATFVVYGSGVGAQPLKTVNDYETLLRRCDAFVRWVDRAIPILRAGMEEGLTHPKPVAQRTAESLRIVASAKLEESPFWKPVTGMPRGFSSDDRSRLTSAWREKISRQVLPAYGRLADFMEHEYLPRARTTVGWNGLPNGLPWYRYEIRTATTLDLEPDDVHAIGLREVARLRTEMDAVRVRVGFQGDLAAFLRFVQTDPRFYFKSGPEMVAAYQEVKTRVDARLSGLFRELPKSGYEIREMEPYRAVNTPGGQYFSAPPDGSRPGVFYVNTHDLMGLPNYITESLSLHEGSPGHHVQVEIAHELKGQPRLQRFESNSAFMEGWALYAETLGRDLGLYSDPYQWYGHLTEQMLRAMRLVVDTGLHTRGWTRGQAVQYMLDNSSMARESIEIEVDRYMVWPGQALAYQTGKMKILALRAKAEQELGEKFDIREFHDQILGSGPLPLGALERKMERWIGATKR